MPKRHRPDRKLKQLIDRWWLAFLGEVNMPTKPYADTPHALGRLEETRSTVLREYREATVALVDAAEELRIDPLPFDRLIAALPRGGGHLAPDVRRDAEALMRRLERIAEAGQAGTAESPLPPRHTVPPDGEAVKIADLVNGGYINRNDGIFKRSGARKPSLSSEKIAHKLLRMGLAVHKRGKAWWVPLAELRNVAPKTVRRYEEARE